MIGGAGKQVTLPLAARYADEWNIGFRTPDEYRQLSSYLDELLNREGRPRSALRRTLMTGIRFGRDQARLDARLAGRVIPEMLQRGMIVGTPNEVREQIARLDEAGVHFNPNIHEAVVTEENPDVPSHTVTMILQKGYFLHDRLLRPAMVKVATGGPETVEEN